MSKPLLNHSGVDARTYQSGGVGVAQVMKPNARAAGGPRALLKVASQHGRIQDVPERPRENETFVLVRTRKLDLAKHR